MRKLILTGSFWMLLSLTLWAQGLPLCQESPFAAGERISMGIMFKWGAVNTEVAQASLRLEKVPYQTDSLYHAVCQVKSASFFDVFYRMRENFQSWFTVDEIRPVEARRNTIENDYTSTNHYIYDWQGNVINADVCINGGTHQAKVLQMKGMSYDIVSLIFHLRNVDWKNAVIGKTYTAPFAIDDEVSELSVTYYGPEVLKVRKLGKKNALRFSCTVVAGQLFEGDQQMQVWFSDDEKHIPLAVMVPLKMGTMWAWLKAWEG